MMGPRVFVEAPRTFFRVYKRPSSFSEGKTRNEVNSNNGVNLKDGVTSKNGVNLFGFFVPPPSSPQANRPFVNSNK